MVATFLVLSLVGTFTLVRLSGQGGLGEPDVSSAASAGASSTPPGEGEAGRGPASPGGTPSDPASPPASPSEAAGPVPVEAKRCSSSGDDAVATAYAGTDRTSCEFAGAVRTAYRKAGTPNDATTLRAFSPVTKKWYSLTCDGGEPVRCTSTTGAVVVLTPA
jgi:hypothetical protein